MQTVPGFHMLLSGDSGLIPAPVARGFFGGGEAEYIRLLVDGIPIGDAESGLINWRMLPASAVERIEALRGPAAAVYGDGALGGVVQAFTARPQTRSGRVEIGVGSFGARSANAAFGQPFRNAALDFIGSYTASDGFRTRSALREGFGSASFRHVSGGRQWTARASFDHLSHDEPGPLDAEQLSLDRQMTSPFFRSDHDANRRSNAAVRFASRAGSLSYSLLGHVSTRGGERLRTLLLAPGVSDRAHREISSSTVGVSMENSIDADFLGSPGQLRFGFDISRAEIDSAYRGLDNDNRPGPETGRFVGHRIQLAGYAAQSVDLGSRARLHGGVRWDGLEDRDEHGTHVSHAAWSPRVGLTALVSNRTRPTTLFVHVSRAFKAATLDQLFDPRPFPDFRGGTFRVSNAGLEPQRAVNVEGGIRQSHSFYRWEFVLYRIAVKNEIDFDPATFTYGNIRRSTHTGAELDLRILEGARVSAGVTYAWTRVSPGDTALQERQLKNIPRHAFRPDVTLTFPGDVMLHASYTRTAGAFADDQNAFRLGDRSTLDFRLAKALGRLAAKLDLLNVTGDEYEEVGFTLTDFRGRIVPFYYPAQGFTIRGGLALVFQKPR